MNRRTILKGALGGIAGLTLSPFPRYALAQANPSIVPVTDGFAVITGAGGNILVRSAGNSQVLVDSGAADASDAVHARLSELPGAGRVEALFNTHWHLDQVGGNLDFGQSGARIIAHEKTKARLSTDYYLWGEDRYEKALPAAARPTETFFEEGEMLVGGERVEYGHLVEAHTDGDIYVFFRDSNVLAVGDAVSPARDPVLDWFGGGWVGGRADSQTMLLELCNEETRVVPSYGPVMGRAELQAEADMSHLLYDRMLVFLKRGMSAEEMVEEGLLEGLYRVFDDPLRFAYDAHKGFWAHHNSLGGEVL